MKKPGSEKFGLALQPQHGKHNLDCKRVIIVRSPNLCFECWQPLHKDSNGDYLRKWKNFFQVLTRLNFSPKMCRQAIYFFRERRRRRERKRKNEEGGDPYQKNLAALQEFFNGVSGWQVHHLILKNARRRSISLSLCYGARC